MLGNKAKEKTVSKALGISYKVQRKRAYFSLGYFTFDHIIGSCSKAREMNKLRIMMKGKKYCLPK